MRSILKNKLAGAAISSSVSSFSVNPSLPFSTSISRAHAVAVPLAEEAEDASFPKEGLEVSNGFNWALAGRGVIVKKKAYHNLRLSELQNHGASVPEPLSGHTLHVRGDVIGGAPEISKAQFKKLLKQVTSHLSSISSVFVQDGAVGSFSKCDAKVRLISDSPSAVLSLSKLLWQAPARAISHDSCPITVYIASSIRLDSLEYKTDIVERKSFNPSAGDILGLGSQSSSGCAAVDVESSSLIVCGKLFSDSNLIKSALSAAAASIISARGGIPLIARLFVSGGSVILLFGPEDTLESCSDLHEALVSPDAGVILSSHGVSPIFRTGDTAAASLFKKPASVTFVASDSTGVLPLTSKLSPGQAAYHFLAGYQDGKFVPAYNEGPSPIDPLALAKAFHSQLKDSGIPSFLINVNAGAKALPGKELVKLVKSTLSDNLPAGKLAGSNSIVGVLKGKYRTFLSTKFQILPEEFSF